MYTYRFTYSRVHHACAEHGDHCEHGYFVPGGYNDVVGCNCNDADPVNADDREDYDLTDRQGAQLLREIAQHVGPIDSVSIHGNSLTAYGSEDHATYTDGFHETRCVHIEADPRLLTILDRVLLPDTPL